METTRRIFWLLVLAALLLVAAVTLSAQLVTDWWWFLEVGHPGVFVRLLSWPWAVRLAGAVAFVAQALIVPRVLALLLMPLAGCNTVQGAGQDLRNAGQTISDEARRARARM